MSTPQDEYVIRDARNERNILGKLPSGNVMCSLSSRSGKKGKYYSGIREI